MKRQVLSVAGFLILFVLSACGAPEGASIAQQPTETPAVPTIAAPAAVETTATPTSVPANPTVVPPTAAATAEPTPTAATPIPTGEPTTIPPTATPEAPMPSDTDPTPEPAQPTPEQPTVEQVFPAPTEEGPPESIGVAPDAPAVVSAVTLQPPYPAAVTTLVQQAVDDLARRRGVAPDTISVVEVQSVVWPDGALGCPRPDEQYPQVTVEGMFIRLQVGEQYANYHRGERGEPFLCER